MGGEGKIRVVRFYQRKKKSLNLLFFNISRQKREGNEKGRHFVTRGLEIIRENLFLFQLLLADGAWVRVVTRITKAKEGNQLAK